MIRVINRIPKQDKSLIKRFNSKINKVESGCWEWTSAMNWKGYGRIHIKLSCNKYVGSQAHRISYIIYNGKIPKGLTVHHKCHNKKCVNPKHLELKTNNENRLEGNCWSAINARKTHCKNGHELLGENLYLHYRDSNKRRGCKMCRKNNVRKHRSNEK